eukprot:CAMPEP_0185552528 /NCGR_PEP_ID=MMETSP1381-20130426/33959_1 /TAXON_ID=298111 /ORGANISM="Pavlova sp., Strain CCMP459" /LENGTH=37 /DNA_ID= /DNA_START= /DNA_END= /DNA_ORIENTATION=
MRASLSIVQSGVRAGRCGIQRRDAKTGTASDASHTGE